MITADNLTNFIEVIRKWNSQDRQGWYINKIIVSCRQCMKNIQADAGFPTDNMAVYDKHLEKSRKGGRERTQNAPPPTVHLAQHEVSCTINHGVYLGVPEKVAAVVERVLGRYFLSNEISDSIWSPQETHAEPWVRVRPAKCNCNSQLDEPCGTGV